MVQDAFSYRLDFSDFTIKFNLYKTVVSVTLGTNNEFAGVARPTLQ